MIVSKNICCPKCGSKEVYFENFRPPKQKDKPYACYNCGWFGAEEELKEVLVMEFLEFKSNAAADLLRRKQVEISASRDNIEVELRLNAKHDCVEFEDVAICGGSWNMQSGDVAFSDAENLIEELQSCKDEDEFTNERRSILQEYKIEK